jgi:hypothetical protein
MKISSALFVVLTSLFLALGSPVHAQSNVRDFGPPSSMRDGPRPGCGCRSVTAYAPVSQVAVPTQVAAPRCGYGGCNSGCTSCNRYRTNRITYVYPTNVPQPYSANVPYTAAYAPSINSNTSYWSSTTPAQYTGRTIFGTSTVYAKDQPAMNVGRYFVP